MGVIVAPIVWTLILKGLAITHVMTLLDRRTATVDGLMPTAAASLVRCYTITQALI